MEDHLVRTWTSEAAPPLEALAGASSAEGHHFVSRALDEWTAGENRFDRPGEGLLLAVVGGIVVGMAGVNIDPYLDDPTVGRLRHLYVVSTHRRQGVGSALVDRCLALARRSFTVLRLRTNDGHAAAFYAALGFETTSETDATHVMMLADSL